MLNAALFFSVFLTIALLIRFMVARDVRKVE